MTTVKLEFELDSEVYPELHAALASLRSTRARAERMRQLAAAGLVWEKVRLHGSAAVSLTEPAAPPSGLVTRPDVRPASPPEPAEPLPPVERRPRRSRAAAPVADRRPADDFVDLAINAEPQAVPPSRKDLEQVIRELPVLLDVVEVESDVNVVEDVLPLASHRDAHAAHDDVALADIDTDIDRAGWSSMNAYPDDVPADILPSPIDDEHAGLPEAALHVTALSHKPATRSRLMKMKERGLFKNG